MNDKFTILPENLPVPEKDEKINHLLGQHVPKIILPATIDSFFDFSSINNRYEILYFFPLMGMCQKEMPQGWNNIPGARGCTPQNISINKHLTDLAEYDVIPIGISTQSIADLKQLSSIRNLSQILVSDNKLEFQKHLNLPVFTLDGNTMYKRLTLVVKNSKIIKIFYPVFPPDKHIFELLEWLEEDSNYHTN